MVRDNNVSVLKRDRDYCFEKWGEYMKRTGLLQQQLDEANHQLEYAVKITNDLQADNASLRELLISVAKTTHKSKELHEWYCKENSKPEIKELMEGK